MPGYFLDRAHIFFHAKQIEFNNLKCKSGYKNTKKAKEN